MVGTRCAEFPQPDLNTGRIVARSGPSRLKILTRVSGSHLEEASVRGTGALRGRTGCLRLSPPSSLPWTLTLTHFSLPEAFYHLNIKDIEDLVADLPVFDNVSQSESVHAFRTPMS